MSHFLSPRGAARSAVRSAVRPVTGVSGSDPDASSYFARIAAAGSSINAANKAAVTNFIAGCKEDGIWDAIDACCLLAGPDSLAGALVPLVGPDPTNVGFVVSDYNMLTGLKGDGIGKYLDANIANNASPNDQHAVLYATEPNSGNQWYMGAGTGAGATSFYGTPALTVRSQNTTALVTSVNSGVGLMGVTRASGSGGNVIGNNVVQPFTQGSQTPFAGDVFVYWVNGAGGSWGDARLGFYSIGTNIDLALLNARITTYLNAVEISDSPLDLPGLIAFYDSREPSSLLNASDAQASDGEAIKTWQDLGPNGYHLTQSVAGLRFTLDADGGPDGGACLIGINDVLKTDAFGTDYSNPTVIVVGKMAACALSAA